MGNPYFFIKKGVCQMPKYIATVLLDVDEVFEGRKSNKEMIKKYLDHKVKIEDVNESLFRVGKVVMRVNEVKIKIMTFD